ncbi:MAG: DUF2235 domain-containing protein [Gammaproteobacteria bacterium]|nr:DUF2235 domain-containing protein [Gammaproteobacteria bacterium]
MKRLVVCCDGTWNTPEMESPTNVVRLARAVRPRGANRVLQIVYYDEGVGTHGPIDRIVGGAMGAGLDFNVRQAYRFLASNYEEDDEIYLFGFSRGAYTVRSLAGMIGFAGMLRRHQLTSVHDAYELYRDEKDPVGAGATKFRECHRTSVPRITLLGCWDTVGAMGIPDKLPGIGLDELFNKRYRWVNTRLGGHVDHALHAMSIDERRTEFKPTAMNSATEGQTLEQVWFPGDHGSVGGGEHHKEPLARAALEWMVESIASVGLGLAIDTRFEGMLACDHNAYSSASRSPIYGREPRDLGSAPEFHDSALRRFVDLPHYADTLAPEQRNLLNAAVQKRNVHPTLRRPTKGTVLEVGQDADVIVLAERQRNDTQILMEADGQYVLSVAETQHWRDGDLPPCDPCGWHVDDEKLAPFFGGLDRMKLPLIRLASDRRVEPKANWFELIGILRHQDGEDRIRISRNTAYTAPYDGRFFALANDVASRIDLFDTYDNNEGWLVLNVRRIA